MREFYVFALILPLFLFSSVTYSADPNQIRRQLPDETQNDIQQLRRDIRTANDDLAILRRDQINYRLEKDFLKEAYASSLQSINIIVAIVFGVITVLVGVFGYFGVKSIRELRTDYAKELEQLKTAKIELERELSSFREKQTAVESRVGDLTKTNEEQDRRLKVLELVEKVGQVIQTRQWQWALNYISVGLGLDPANLILLGQKATCHGKLGEFSSAIESAMKILEIAPGDVACAWNLMELLALTSKSAEFESIYSKHKASVDEQRNGALIVYLRALLAMTKGDLLSAKAHLAPYVDKCADGAAPRLGEWAYDEAMHAISQMSDGDLKRFASNVVKFFQGALPKQEFSIMLA